MKAQIVSFHCVLKNKLGKVLSSSFNRDVINQLESEASPAADPQLRGLVAGLQNVQEGERREVFVPAAEAYGPYDPSLVVHLSRDDLRRGYALAVGDEVIGQAGPSSGQRSFRVIQADRDGLVLDGNHPLAGQDLVFDVSVVSAREANSEEIEEIAVTAAPARYLH